MSKITPMQRSLKILKSQDVIFQRVEYWHHYAKKRFDLYGIIDVLILDGARIIGLQICGNDYQSHIRKLTIEKKQNSIAWLKSGAELQIWSWRQYKKKRGGKAREWRVVIADILLVGKELYVEERK